MKRYKILLQKMSKEGDTAIQWTMTACALFTGNAEATCEVRRLTNKPSEHGGPIAFCAQVIVIWDCAEWDANQRKIVEAWANGALTIQKADFSG